MRRLTRAGAPWGPVFRRVRGARRRGDTCWPLGVHLLGPLIVVVAIPILLLIGIGWTTRVQLTRELIGLHRDSARSLVVQWLNGQRARQEVAARLLASDPDLAAALAEGDRAALDRLLPALQERAAVDRVATFDVRGARLAEAGDAGLGGAEGRLVDSALGRGLTSSAIAADGLVVSAAAPVGAPGSAPGAVVGAVLVGRLLAEPELREAGGRLDLSLAVYARGVRVAGPADAPAHVRGVAEEAGVVLPLDGPPETTRGGAPPGASGASAARPASVAAGDALVALIPPSTVAMFSARHGQLMGVISLGILVMLPLVGLHQLRRVNRPLQRMVATARAIRDGDYRQRVPESSIRELRALGGAINEMAAQLELHVASLTQQAFYDILTGLPNRALFRERLERALSRAKRPDAVAVLYLDLDNFKLVNDSLGHDAGDSLLVQVAERLRGAVRAQDTVARLGGDEFTVLLEHLTGLAEAQRVAARIAERLSAPCTVQGQEVFAGGSVGIALAGAGSSADAVMKQADLAMYQAKARGKGCAVVFTPSMAEHLADRLGREAGLRRALERGELRVYYQPIVDLAAGGVSEVEALVRWAHPTDGLIPPDRFLPLAEETGLIVPIGRWILAEACRQVAAWRQAMPGSDLRLSVNLSARQLEDPGFVEAVAAVLAESGLDPAALTFDITEPMLRQDAEAPCSSIGRLKTLGVMLAVDDFGTGYSSLAYLQRLPVDVVKIDRSFVDRVGRDEQSASVVGAIITLARSLGLAVTGEGIETAEQFERLSRLGCDHGQGYLFARPLPADVCAAHLRPGQGRPGQGRPGQGRPGQQRPGQQRPGQERISLSPAPVPRFRALPAASE